METCEEGNKQGAEEQSLFPTAVSEEKLDEARRKNSFKQLFGSKRIFVTSSEKPADRPEGRGLIIILQRKAAEHSMRGKEAMAASQYEKAVICFSKGITLQPRQTDLYVDRAEAFLQLCDFQSAAASYHQSGASSSRLAFVFFLQGQCLFDGGLVSEALEAFSRAVEVKPCRTYEVRRLACLSAAGQHTDCLTMVNDWMLADGPTSDLYVLRARLHKLLHQTSRCYQDVMAALASTPSCPAARVLLLQLQAAGEQARQKAVDRAASGRLPEALCMINVALENQPRDARLYLFRGILYRRLKDFTAAIEDLVQAEEVRGQEEEVRGHAERVSVEEDVHVQLVLTYNDFAVQFFSRGLYEEATLLLNKAIEEEKNRAGLYLNRGDCFFKQGDWCFSLADYQQAAEMMRPDDPSVRLRLAVLHNTLGSLCFQDGSFQEAADMFSLAVRYDPTASRYYENRSKTFRKLLNMEAARRDFICLLILDPTNEELPPMLMGLFPGCSLSEVLSSPAGQEVRTHLMDSIQTCSSSSGQQRLSETLLKMNLTNENTVRPSADPSDGGQELKMSVSQQEVKITVKNLLQVLEEESE